MSCGAARPREQVFPSRFARSDSQTSLAGYHMMFHDGLRLPGDMCMSPLKPPVTYVCHTLTPHSLMAARPFYC